MPSIEPPSFVGHQPFFHLVSDHLYISRASARCARAIGRVGRAEPCSVSAVQPTRESMLEYYGAMGGRRSRAQRALPELKAGDGEANAHKAEQDLVVPGLRRTLPVPVWDARVDAGA